MNSRFQFVSGVAAVAALVALASSASAGKLTIASKDLITPPDGLITGLATVHANGFEAFANGSVEPQFGYSSSGVNLPWQTVSTASPFAGAKHMRFIHDTTVGNGTQRLVFTPNLPQPANSPSQVKIQVKISNDGGA